MSKENKKYRRRKRKKEGLHLYNRAKELKELLLQIPEFQEAIYEEGILKDLRFTFSYQNETFVLIYKFDYSNPRLYRKRKDGYLTEVKKYIIPKEIKQKKEHITEQIKQINSKYYPFIPNDSFQIGNTIFKTKFLSEYATNNKIIDYIVITFEVLVDGQKHDVLELGFLKENQQWKIEKEYYDDSIKNQHIHVPITLFKKEILKQINAFEKSDEILDVVDLFLKRTE